MAIGSYPSPPSEVGTDSPFRLDGWVTVNLKDGHDTAGAGMKVKMRESSTFANLFGHFKARSCNNCRAPDEMRFKLDAKLLTGSDSPSKAYMYPGCVYTIHVWSNVPGLQCKDCRRTGYPKTTEVDTRIALTTPPACTNGGKSETVTVLVRDQTGFETSVKMLNTTPFDSLMTTYSERAMRDLCVCRFLFDGERVVEKETPKQLGMINNDRIEVFIEQHGG